MRGRLAQGLSQKMGVGEGRGRQNGGVTASPAGAWLRLEAALRLPGSSPPLGHPPWAVTCLLRRHWGSLLSATSPTCARKSATPRACPATNADLESFVPTRGE